MQVEPPKASIVKALRFRRPMRRWLLILVASIGWLVISGDLPGRVAGLYPDSVPAHPYVRLDHGFGHLAIGSV